MSFQQLVYMAFSALCSWFLLLLKRFLLADAALLCRQANRQMNNKIIFATSAHKPSISQNAATKIEKKHSPRLFDRYYCYEQCMLINLNSCCDSLFLSREHAPHTNILSFKI